HGDRVAAGPLQRADEYPWHGNAVAGAATGALNNLYGGAGTGGQVADPMLLKVPEDWFGETQGLRTAVAWGADVANISAGTRCDNVFCDLGAEFNLLPALRGVRDSGAVTVVSAGNANANASGVVPCRWNEAICVGELDATTNQKSGVSNYGA